MQTVKLRESAANYILAKRQRLALGKKPHATSFGHKANWVGLATNGETPSEVFHLLIDYRDNNEVIARAKMDRSRAFHLNERLKGSGFGWSVKTGY